MDKSRFSMLLLEPGEIYFEDYSCTFSEIQSATKGNPLQGSLKLCSKSLVFEPRSWCYPLIKLQFKDFTELILLSNDSQNVENVIKITVKQLAEMLEDNVLAPYKFIYDEKKFLIKFDFASAEECLSQMEQLHRASTLHAPEHNSMVATILHSRYMRMVFDPVMMDDFTEEIICELQAEKISPLVRHQGKLALTPTTIYFQPFSNIEDSPILKIKLESLRRMYKRRFLLRQVGLEIYANENSTVPHIYLTFQSEQDRDKLFTLLEQSPNVILENVYTEEIMLQWQNGVVSNYDYLMHLNCLADRSKNDLTQYPVFPWVVSDYESEILDLNNVDTFRDLSKPMGALNHERLSKLKERYNEMTEPKFLYGSHYSAPALVLFYLVRKYPHYMLCLQNGRFDHPDRMFNSVKDVFNNCLNNMSDFKELVPEFYDTEAESDFLVNKSEINFGQRHDGSEVSDVVLPPWAVTSASFVHKLREALESEYVSRHLHLWIDLIFGYKQRGEEAVKANNVFHYVCYEGTVDLDNIYDMNDKHALEVQIMEFGQVPKQLFTKPHVRKITHHIPKSLTDMNENDTYDLECIDIIKLHKEAVTCAIREGNKVISVGKDGALKVYDLEQEKQIRSVILSTTPLSSCVMIDKNVVAVGSWSNEIFLYDVEYGSVIESFRAHDDSVNCLLWVDKEGLLISGGSDGVVRVWALAARAGPALRSLKAEFDHDDNVTALAYRRREHQIDIIAGTSGGEVVVWEARSKALTGRARAHAGPVRAARPLPARRALTAGGDSRIVVTDLSVLHQVYNKQLDEPVWSLCCDAASTLWLGGGDGSLRTWNMLTVTQINELKAHHDGIYSVHLDASSKTLITASKDKTVKIWQLVPRSDPNK